MSSFEISSQAAEHLRLLHEAKRRSEHELARLRAENSKLKKMLNRGIALMPIGQSDLRPTWIAEAVALVDGREVPGE